METKLNTIKILVDSLKFMVKIHCVSQNTRRHSVKIFKKLESILEEDGVTPNVMCNDSILKELHFRALEEYNAIRTIDWRSEFRRDRFIFSETTLSMLSNQVGNLQYLVGIKKEYTKEYEKLFDKCFNLVSEIADEWISEHMIEDKDGFREVYKEVIDLIFKVANDIFQ